MQEFFQTLAASTVTIPAHEIMVVLILQSLCYLFRSPRMGLLVSCAFVYRLGWSFLLVHYGSQEMSWVFGYVGLGLFLLGLALYGMYRDSE